MFLAFSKLVCFFEIHILYAKIEQLIIPKTYLAFSIFCAKKYLFKTRYDMPEDRKDLFYEGLCLFLGNDFISNYFHILV